MVSVSSGSPATVPLTLTGLLLFLAAVVVLIVPASAQGVARRTTVQITSPSSLQKEGGYEHLEALFGDYPRRWATIEANLIYVDSELCDSIPLGDDLVDDLLVDEDDGIVQDDDDDPVDDFLVDEDDGIVQDDDDDLVDDFLVDEDDGIVQDDDDDLVDDSIAPDDDPLKDDGISIVQADSRSLPQPLYRGYILMVDRGSCTFVKKVRNAQRLGAVAVIIADNVCLCSDPDCTSSRLVCETSLPILTDDGSGDDISIPSFLLFKKDADRIKESISNSASVTMKLEWAQGGITEKVEYELWTTPYVLTKFDGFVMTFLSNFDRALGDQAKFTPHQQIIDGVSVGCRINGENYCENLCTNHGRYCAYTNHDWMGVSGKDFVVENLRRLCIRDLFDDRAVWWNYTMEFANRCDTQDFYMNNDCVKDCMKQSGINSTLIENCMRQSGGTDQDVPNSLLDNEIFKENRLGKFLFLPALVVNGHYANPNNELTPTFVLDAICGDYFAKSEPEVCRICKDSTDVAQCVSNFNGSNSTLGDVVADSLGNVVAGGMRTFMPTMSYTLMGILSGLNLFGLV